MSLSVQYLSPQNPNVLIRFLQRFGKYLTIQSYQYAHLSNYPRIRVIWIRFLLRSNQNFYFKPNSLIISKSDSVWFKFLVIKILNTDQSYYLITSESECSESDSFDILARISCILNIYLLNICTVYRMSQKKV